MGIAFSTVGDNWYLVESLQRLSPRIDMEFISCIHALAELMLASQLTAPTVMLGYSVVHVSVLWQIIVKMFICNWREALFSQAINHYHIR